ncbi:MAG TPA: hypothetical protein VGR45_18315 [Stellaceae bacterium]|nr:hypothetical protein [Stellaceae bacterium]
MADGSFRSLCHAKNITVFAAERHFHLGLRTIKCNIRIGINFLPEYFHAIAKSKSQRFANCCVCGAGFARRIDASRGRSRSAMMTGKIWNV